MLFREDNEDILLHARGKKCIFSKIRQTCDNNVDRQSLFEENNT